MKLRHVCGSAELPGIERYLRNDVDWSIIIWAWVSEDGV